MQQAQCPPDGLAALPPGPELAAALAAIELDQVSEGQTVEVLRACAAQLAHDHARFLAAMVQVGRVSSTQARCDEAAGKVALEWVGAEIGAALSWSTGKADRELRLAQFLVERLPPVFAELAAGRIDQGRAWTFVDVLDDAELTDAQLHRVCAAVVPTAHSLTSGQIRARLLKLLISIDPGYAARRYRKAVRERNVRGYLNKDGAGVITGTGLATEEAVAACKRIERLADAVSDAGHPGSIGQIRADLFTGLLDGRLDGLTPNQMITALLADTASSAETADEVATPAASDTTCPTRAAADDDAQADTAADTAADGTCAASDDPAPDDTAPDDAAADQDTAPDEAATATPIDQPGATADGAPPESAPQRPRRGGEIRIGLATLLHRDEHPGEIPGWGPVIADVARGMATLRRRGEWRFAVTDADGHLILAGVTRRRPRSAAHPGEGHPGEGRTGSGGIVEISVTAEQLLALAAHSEACGEWAGVIADIAGQYARRDRIQQILDARPHARFAHAVLRRHVQIRDRTCVAPGCRRPARRCDLDHTLDHDLGGLTVAANSGPLCRRHHRMKHDGGWQLEQPRPGHFHWTSPLGQTYRTRGEPICPPQPEPLPRGPDQHPAGDDLDDDTTTTTKTDANPGPVLWVPNPPPPRPLPPPPPDLPDEPPF